MIDFPGNSFTRGFGVKLPIVQGPIGGAAGPELVAAVADAGGLGISPVWTMSLERLEQEVREIQKLTSRPFAVNLRADLVQIDLINVAIDCGVPIIHLFWGDPSASAARIRSSNAKMLVTVGDSEAARTALDAGADALVAQGVEAGGHVLGQVPLRKLLNSLVPIANANDVPIIAAGGIATAKDVATVIDEGASAALLGTRFVATIESVAHDDYKAALVEAGTDSTVRSECFDLGWPNAPHRHLKNATYRAWEMAGAPGPGSRPGEGEVVLKLGDVEVPRYAATPPRRGMIGSIRDGVMYAGTGVDRITDCPHAGDLVRELASLL